MYNRNLSLRISGVDKLLPIIPKSLSLSILLYMVNYVNPFTRARLTSTHTRDPIVCFLKMNDYNQRDFIRFLKKLKTTAKHIFPHKSDGRNFRYFDFDLLF